MKPLLPLFSLAFFSLMSVKTVAQKNNVIWKTKAYSIYSDSVVQGAYTARALSSTEIVSNYKSPVNLLQPTKIAFKFSINGKDNEMQPGVDHHFNVLDGIKETPVIKFGEALKDNTTETDKF